jgi:ribosomal protein L18, bacterial type
MPSKMTGRERRKRRIRKKISGSVDKPRMSVFRSLNHISVQIVDDSKSTTLAAASTYEKEFRGKKGSGNCAAAKAVGEIIAERAKAKGIERVVFDRNGCLYHGRVKALAEAARGKGLKF